VVNLHPREYRGVSHIVLSADTYRGMGLMVGDRVTLEMAKV